MVDESTAFGSATNFAASGVAWADVTGDGWLDVVASGSTGNMVLAGVSGELRFRDVTSELSIGGLAGGSRLLSADYDADGDTDLLLDGGPDGMRVLRNRGASGFDDATSRFLLPDDTTSAVWVDRDGSGTVDLGLTSPDQLRVMQNPRSGLGALRLRARTDSDADAHAADAQPDRDAIGAILRVDLDGDGDWATGSKSAFVLGQSGVTSIVNGLLLESATLRVDFVDGEGIESSATASTSSVDALDPLAPVLSSAKLASSGKRLTVDGLRLPASGGAILLDETSLGGVKAPPRFVGTDGTSSRLVGKDSRLTQLLQSKPVAVRVFVSGVFTAPVVLR
jgi:hypothetical protein